LLAQVASKISEILSWNTVQFDNLGIVARGHALPDSIGHIAAQR